MGPRSTAFLARWEHAAAVPDEAELEALLADAAARGRAAWPEVEVTDEELAAFLAARTPPGPIARGLQALCVEDLYLACACERGDGAALAAFERAILPAAAPAVRRLSSDAAFNAEIAQRVRAHLLAPRPGAPPRLLEYRGRGALGAWVRMVAVRLALQLLRGERRELGRAERLEHEPRPPVLDAELEYLRGRFKEPFKRAFEAALRGLSAEQRTMLQLHFVEGMSLGQIGTLYRADKSTVSRRMARARERILEILRAELELSVPRDEVSSLLGMLRSQMDLSLERLLGGMNVPRS